MFSAKKKKFFFNLPALGFCSPGKFNSKNNFICIMQNEKNNYSPKRFYNKII